jgi:hypothetical protein
MWEPQPYGPSWPVTGIALPFYLLSHEYCTLYGHLFSSLIKLHNGCSHHQGRYGDASQYPLLFAGGEVSHW